MKPQHLSIRKFLLFVIIGAALTSAEKILFAFGKYEPEGIVSNENNTDYIINSSLNACASGRHVAY